MVNPALLASFALAELSVGQVVLSVIKILRTDIALIFRIVFLCLQKPEPFGLLLCLSLLLSFLELLGFNFPLPLSSFVLNLFEDFFLLFTLFFQTIVFLGLFLSFQVELTLYLFKLKF